MNIFDFIDAWELDKNTTTPRKPSRRDLDNMIEGMEGLYSHVPPAQLGRVNLGVHDALNALEHPDIPIETLGSHLLLFDNVWLPDPLFGALSERATDEWKGMPDAGGSRFSGEPGARTSWKSVLQVPVSERKQRFQQLVRDVVPKLMKLRPFVEAGVVTLYPWELVSGRHQQAMLDVVTTLQGGNLPKEVRARYPQDQYSLGPRLGGIGIQAGENPPPGLNPYEKMWFGDHTPVLVYGLLNVAIAADLGTSFAARLPGDRLVYDFVKTGGMGWPSEVSLGPPVSLPDFSRAAWEDIIAIREQSELLSELRRIVSQASGLQEDQAAEAVRDAVSALGAAIRTDTSLVRAAGEPTLAVALSAFGAVLGAATIGDPLTGATAGALISGAPAHVRDFAQAVFGEEAKDARRRAELVTRLSAQL